MSIAQDVIYNHFTTVLLVILCGIKLHSQRKAKDVEMHYFWMTLICCFLLAVEDSLETFTATDESMRFWRVLLSVIGYVLRPVAAVGLLMVICPPEHRSWKIWIPALVNTAVNLTAFFSPIAFSYDADYDFVRGPLGYVVFVVSFLYLILIVVVILNRFYEGKRADRWVLVCSGLGVIGAALVDAILAGRHLNEAIMIGCIFTLFYLRSHDNYLDPLTSLRNRFAFYDDCDNLLRYISAVASIDMNGLKKLNDSRGHAAGDAALVQIGKCLSDVSDRRTIPYRVGGDEFVILFLGRDAQAVEDTLRMVRASVSAVGYSVSAGYAMKQPDQTLDDAVRESDQNMYLEKAEYYRKCEAEQAALPTV